MKKMLAVVVTLAFCGVAVCALSIEKVNDKVQKSIETQMTINAQRILLSAKVEGTLEKELSVLAEENEEMKKVIVEETKCRINKDNVAVCVYPQFYDCASWRTDPKHPQNMFSMSLVRIINKDLPSIFHTPVNAVARLFYPHRTGLYYEFVNRIKGKMSGVTPLQCPKYKGESFAQTCAGLSDKIGVNVVCVQPSLGSTPLFKSIHKDFGDYLN